MKTMPNTMRQASLNALFAPIQDDLRQVEIILQETLESKRPGVAQLVAYLENYRGKRLRPTLLLLTANACGDVAPAHHTLGAVVEMIHTATLVHDDVLDRADTRRHVDTVNHLWGNQASVLLGDYLFTKAFHLTSTIGDAEACRLIGEATNRVCEGELHQILRRGELALTEAEYYDIIDGKTAELTSLCCRLGARYAGAPEETVEHLAEYGRRLGVAFQIADDVLDLVGRETLAGKSLGTDLEQQKLTLPLIHVLRHADPEERRAVERILHNGTPNKREKLQSHLERSESLAFARCEAERCAKEAASHLACLPPSHCREVLQRLAAKVVHRDC